MIKTIINCPVFHKYLYTPYSQVFPRKTTYPIDVGHRHVTCLGQWHMNIWIRTMSHTSRSFKFVVVGFRLSWSSYHKNGPVHRGTPRPGWISKWEDTWSTAEFSHSRHTATNQYVVREGNKSDLSHQDFGVVCYVAKLFKTYTMQCYSAKCHYGRIFLSFLLSIFPNFSITTMYYIITQ